MVGVEARPRSHSLLLAHSGHSWRRPPRTASVKGARSARAHHAVANTKQLKPDFAFYAGKTINYIANANPGTGNALLANMPITGIFNNDLISSSPVSRITEMK